MPHVTRLLVFHFEESYYRASNSTRITHKTAGISFCTILLQGLKFNKNHTQDCWYFILYNPITGPQIQQESHTRLLVFHFVQSYYRASNSTRITHKTAGTSFCTILLQGLKFNKNHTQDCWYFILYNPITGPQIQQESHTRLLVFHFVQSYYRASNSTRITESILIMILITFRYENQFLSLNYIVIQVSLIFTNLYNIEVLY